MADKAPNTDYVVKPTLKPSEITPRGKKFEKNFAAANAVNSVNLSEANEIMNEIDMRLDEKQGTLKKKIWDLSKMEALVHSDPKLESVYQEMEREAEENQRYGYHWNEAVLNIMFNDYVLNSPKYLQKYKMAIPKEKKRRDKSGIKQQQKAGEVEMKKKGVDTKDLTVNKTPTNVPENYDHNNSLEGVMEQQRELMENWAGDTSDEVNRQPVDQSNQRDYLDHRLKKKYDTMNEHHLNSREEKESFIYKHKPSLVMGQIKSLSDEKIDKLYKDIEGELGMLDDSTPKVEPETNAGENAPLDESINENGDMIAAQQEKDEENIDETTGTAGPGGGTSGSGAFETKAGLDPNFGKKKKKNKGVDSPFWVGGEMVESNYLTNPLLFENIYNYLNEDAIGPESDSTVPLSEKAKSKNQQQFMGMVHAAQKGELDNPSASVEKVAKEMKPDDVEDFASTKHKGLPEKVKTNEDDFNSGGDIGDDPTKEEMINFLKQQYGEEYDDFSAEEAIYWYGYENHGGQNSNLYSALSTSEYKPSPMMNNSSDIEGVGEMMYNDLVNNYGGDDVEESIVKPEGSSIMDTMKDVPAGGGGDTSSFGGGGGMFEGNEIDEDVRTRTKCKKDEEPVKGKAINQPGGCKKKISLNTSPEDKQKNPHNIKSRQKRIKRQETEMETKNKEQSNILNTSKKELAEQKAMFEAILGEDKKPASLVNVERLGKENKKNFVKDKKDSTLSDVVDTEDELSATAQIENVGENPYDLAEKIEAQKIKDNKMQSFDNEGDSTNDDNKHIPKRNLTSDEDEQVSLMRNGMHSLVYDNKPSDRFEERMERDMGEEIYDLRQKQMDFKAKAPMYNKDAEPVEDTTVDTDQHNKYKKKYVSQFGESVVTGKYRDEYNKTKYINFKLNEVKKIKSVDESFSLINMDGLGNRYTTKVELIEGFDKVIEKNNYYIKEGKLYVVSKNKSLTENKKADKKIVNKGLDNMKKLWGYNPSDYTETKYARNLFTK